MDVTIVVTRGLSEIKQGVLDRLEQGVLDVPLVAYGPRKVLSDWYSDPGNHTRIQTLAVRYGSVLVRLAVGFAATEDRIDVLWLDGEAPRPFPEFWFDHYEGTTIENVTRFWDQKLALRDLAAGGSLGGTQVMVWKDGYVNGNLVLFRSPKAKSMLAGLREAGLERVRVMSFDDPIPDVRDRMTVLGALA